MIRHLECKQAETGLDEGLINADLCLIPKPGKSADKPSNLRPLGRLIIPRSSLILGKLILRAGVGFTPGRFACVRDTLPNLPRTTPVPSFCRMTVYEYTTADSIRNSVSSVILYQVSAQWLRNQTVDDPPETQQPKPEPKANPLRRFFAPKPCSTASTSSGTATTKPPEH